MTQLYIGTIIKSRWNDAQIYCKEFMGDMSEEIERENKIINDLLSLVKMDKTANNANTMNIKSENMNELVEKILKETASDRSNKKY